MFVTGHNVLFDGRERILRAFGGDAWREATLYGLDPASGDWRTTTHDDDPDVDALLWVGRDEAWIARYDGPRDLCLIATAAPRCAPTLDRPYWMTPGGALDPSGFEPEAPDRIVAAMKAAYDATSMPLCDGDAIARELRAAAAEVVVTPQLVVGCRRLVPLLYGARLLDPPPAAVHPILRFTRDAQFWPEGDERSLWADGPLSELDRRKDALERARGDDVRRALGALAASPWGPTASPQAPT